jgi:hypothetical protein
MCLKQGYNIDEALHVKVRKNLGKICSNSLEGADVYCIRVSGFLDRETVSLI